MSLIKSLYQIINPQISLRHFEIPEDTERGKINRKFISFNAENTIINNVFTAKVLAKKWENVFLC